MRYVKVMVQMSHVSAFLRTKEMDLPVHVSYALELCQRAKLYSIGENLVMIYLPRYIFLIQ